MSLNGTLETFALPDVLALLAATKKTGELQVEGGRGSSRLWLDNGEMVGADVPRATTFVDALFEMLRLTSGKFAFDNDGKPATPVAPMGLEPLLQEAQSRLGEWKSIEAVVPSLACAVKLAAEVSGAHVSVTAEQWRTLVAVATNTDVEGVMTSLKQGEFESCRMLKDLVQMGLVAVEDAPPAPAKAPEPAAAKSPPAPATAERPAEAASKAYPPPRPTSPPSLAAVAGRAQSAEGGSEAMVPAGARASEAAPAPATAKAPAKPAAASGPGGTVTSPTRDDTATAKPAGKPIPAPAPASAKSPSTSAAPEPKAAPTKAVPTKAEQDEADEESAQLVHQLAQLQGDTPSPGPTTLPSPSPRHATTGSTAPAAATAPAPAPAAPAAAAPAAAAPAAAPAAAAEEEAPREDEAKAEEPLNRGLLLKFLNSVRS